MIYFFLFLQVAVSEPQLTRDSLNKALLPIRREIEALKLAVRRSETVAAEQAGILSEARSLMQASQEREAQQRRTDSALMATRLATVGEQLSERETESDRLMLNTVGLGLALALGTGLFFWLLSQRIATSEQRFDVISSVRQMAEAADLEVRAVRAELQRLELFAKTGTDARPADHSFPLAVAGELHRMLTRTRSMPAETVGLTALRRSLERLGEALDTLGYSIPELVGKPYVEGLVLEARFVPSDSLNPGEKVITKVVRPQVNFRDTLIQAADVEVSTG